MAAKDETSAGSVWLRPQRSRGGRPTLTTQQIVPAAIEILDTDGVEGLSMRTLAAKLGAGTASLYWHVANKDELLELALDDVQGEIAIPAVGKVGWRAAVGALAAGIRDTALRHPWMIGLAGVKPPIGPKAMRLNDVAAGMLAAAGFSGAAVSRISALLSAYAMGAAAAENSCRQGAAQPGQAAGQMRASIEAHWRSVAEQYPNLAHWRSENPSATFDQDTFLFGLDRILDGIAVWHDRAPG